jgi:hypothetical protein
LKKQARAQKLSWLTQTVSHLLSHLPHLLHIWLLNLDAVSYGQYVEKLLELISKVDNFGGIED